jgi:hypothetical protein
MRMPGRIQNYQTANPSASHAKKVLGNTPPRRIDLKWAGVAEFSIQVLT